MKECNSCGKCCIKYGDGGLSASPVEIERWELLRPDIASYVNDDKIWMNPKTGVQLEQCPFLRKDPLRKKFLCEIYYDRPDDCRFYPSTVDEMLRDECEMIEAKDVSHPRQAKKDLARIMSDSRSPRE